MTPNFPACSIEPHYLYYYYIFKDSTIDITYEIYFN